MINDPTKESVLNDMREGMEKIQLPDGTKRFQVKYVTQVPLNQSFPSDLSNYNGALKQAKHNFLLKLAQQGGKDAVAEMVARGLWEDHFRLLSEEEAKQVLQEPNYFFSQTVTFKSNSNMTKIRHVSNPSSIGKESGQSFNLCQRTAGDLMNNSLWPLQSFVLYPFPYLSDISSAYCRIKLHSAQRKFQLLILFYFTKETWWDFPIITELQGLALVVYKLPCI